MRTEFETTLSFDDFLAANRLVFRRRWTVPFFRRGILQLSIFVAGVNIALELALNVPCCGFQPNRFLSIIPISIGVSAAGFITIFLLSLWHIQKSARKSYAQSRMEGVVAHYSFDNCGIRCESEPLTIAFAWAHARRWLEDDRMLLIAQSDAMFLIITKALLDPPVLRALRDTLMSASVQKDYS